MTSDSMKRLLLLPLLCAIVFTLHPTTSDAQTCPTGYFNMLDWMNLNTGATQHLTGTSNPQYTVLPANNIFWHIKEITADKAIRGTSLITMPTTYMAGLQKTFGTTQQLSRPRTVKQTSRGRLSVFRRDRQARSSAALRFQAPIPATTFTIPVV